MLDAHEALCEAAPENLSRFKDVLDYLKQDLHHETRQRIKSGRSAHVAILLLGLLVASLAGWFSPGSGSAWRIRQLERSKEEIQVEETLVFDFLHGLGEAFTRNDPAADLHRLIVEGAARILDAHGGALYMADRTGTQA